MSQQVQNLSQAQPVKLTASITTLVTLVLVPLNQLYSSWELVDPPPLFGSFICGRQMSRPWPTHNTLPVYATGSNTDHCAPLPVREPKKEAWLLLFLLFLLFRSLHVLSELGGWVGGGRGGVLFDVTRGWFSPFISHGSGTPGSPGAPHCSCVPRRSGSEVRGGTAEEELSH